MLEEYNIDYSDKMRFKMARERQNPSKILNNAEK